MDVDVLHLDRTSRNHLRQAGITTIGELAGAGYVSVRAWDALGRGAGKTAGAAIQELARACCNDRADLKAFWEARAILVTPPEVAASPDLATLLAVLPQLVRVALADDAPALANPEREWVIVDGRHGLVSRPKTLEELGSGVLGLTRERVRQLEANAMSRLRRAWEERFHGTAYRLNPALDSVLARVVEVANEVNGPVWESALFDSLGVGGRLHPKDLRCLFFILQLAGLVRLAADGRRRPPVWAPADDKSVAPLLELSDRLGRLLTEERADAMSETDIAVEVNRGRRSNRVSLADVRLALAISQCVERLDDGRWRGQFEYLAGRPDQAFRIIAAAGRPLDLDIVAREMNAKVPGKPVQVRNLSNQLSGDRRFVPIGRSGAWGLADRDGANAATIVEIMVDALRCAGRPLAAHDIRLEVEARRSVAANSVSIYLQMRPEFTLLPEGSWALSTWPEAVRAAKARAALGDAKVPTLGERVAAVAISYLRGAPEHERELIDVVRHVSGELDVAPDNIYGYLQGGRIPEIERADHDGRRLVRLISGAPIDGRGVPRARTGRKPVLADRIAGVLVPYLEAAPNGERDLADVVRRVTTELHVIPATVYGYLKRIPQVERADRDGRTIVRLAGGAMPVAVTAPEPGASGLRQLVLAGETPKVEFKSTLRWSVVGAVDSPALQKMCTKTIAAFANTKGGTLLIGVGPDGGVYGIELDCAILQKKDDTCVDAFSRSLASIVSQHLGVAIAAQMSTHYVALDEKTVCVVEVPPNREPVYLNDGKSIEFYVRNGTTSVALDLPHVAPYIRSRWS
jgi:Putative DNA-binding domain/Sigma-70, region 4